MTELRQFFLILTLISLISCGKPKVSPPETPGAIPVQIHKVSRGPLIPEIRASGVIKGKNETIIVSETQGRIIEITLALGKFVEADQPLITVDNTVVQIQLAQAQEELESARLELRAAERFFNQGGLSQAELNRARSALKGAEARYQAAANSAADKQIKAPISGWTASISPGITLGATVTPGQIIGRVTDLRTLKTEISLGEKEVGLIKTGDGAIVTIPALRDLSIQGSVSAVAAGADPSTGAFILEIEFPGDPERPILSGMTAQTVIVPGRSPEGLWIPDRALVTRKGKTGLFVAENGTARFREIEIERKYQERVIAAEGIVENDRVILSGLPGLSDGTLVLIKEEP